MEWEFKYLLPLEDDSPPFSITVNQIAVPKAPAPPVAPDSFYLFTFVKVRFVPDNYYELPVEWKFDNLAPLEPTFFASPTVSQAPPSNNQPSTPCFCRTCKQSFALRNLLFAYLYDYGHCRPDKLARKTSSSSKFLWFNNIGWRTGKVTMDFGVLGDVISKLIAVAFAV